MQNDTQNGNYVTLFVNIFREKSPQVMRKMMQFPIFGDCTCTGTAVILQCEKRRKLLVDKYSIT